MAFAAGISTRRIRAPARAPIPAPRRARRRPVYICAVAPCLVQKVQVEKSLLTKDEQAHFAANPHLAWLVAQRAEAMGDRARCAAIFHAATGQRLTATNFDSLMHVAKKHPDYDWGAFGHECMAQQSDEELLARIIHSCIYHPPAKYPRPPEDKRPAQSWIDHFVAVSKLPRDDQAELKWSEPVPPPFEPFTACHASANMQLNPLGLIPSQQG